MKDILKKLKLIENFTTDLEISRAEFVQKLSAITDKEDMGMFSGTVEAFSISKYNLKGHVDFNGFKLKKRNQFFDGKKNMAVATGIIKEHHGYLRIESEVSGFNNSLIVQYIFAIIFCSIIVFAFATGAFDDSNTDFFSISFATIFGILVFVSPYFTMRYNMLQLKHELEREFSYLTKQK